MRQKSIRVFRRYGGRKHSEHWLVGSPTSEGSRFLKSLSASCYVSLSPSHAHACSCRNPPHALPPVLSSTAMNASFAWRTIATPSSSLAATCASAVWWVTCNRSAFLRKCILSIFSFLLFWRILEISLPQKIQLMLSPLVVCFLCCLFFSTLKNPQEYVSDHAPNFLSFRCMTQKHTRKQRKSLGRSHEHV